MDERMKRELVQRGNIINHVVTSIKKVLDRPRFKLNTSRPEVHRILIDHGGLQNEIICHCEGNSIGLIGRDVKWSENNRFYYNLWSRTETPDLRRIGTILANQVVMRPVYLLARE